jgi:hypothetical protein
MLIPAILSALDFLLLTSFFQSHFKQQKSSKIQMGYLAAYSIWISRILIFSYLLLFEDLKMFVWPLVAIIFIGPHLTMFIIDRVEYFSSIRRVKLFQLISISLVVYLISLLGENTWDGSAYHLPIELLVTKYNSLFGWPDFIYAQWQQSTIQLGAAYLDILFGTYFAGSMVSIISFIFLIYLFADFTKIKIWLASIILLCIPPVFHQIGTRYIDITIGIAVFAFFILMFQFFESNENLESVRYSDKFVFFCIFPVSALMIGAKSSSFLPVAFVWFYFIVRQFYSKKNRIRKQYIRSIKLTLIIGLGSIFGVLPVFIRNIIEFSNPFYPYKVPGFENGLFGHSKVSNYLTGFYSNQVNLDDVPMTLAVFFQYFISPFQPLLVIFQSFDFSPSKFVSGIASNEVIYRTFVYDNRLGGFGLLFVILVIAYLMYANTKFARATFLVFFLVFSILPTTIHPRYYLGIGLISLAIVVRALSLRKILSKRFFFSLVMVCAIFSISANIFSWFARTTPSISAVNTFDENSKVLAQRINPLCLDSIHIGSGLWATTGLFGPSACSLPFFSLTVGGSLIDANIGPRFLVKKDLIQIEGVLRDRYAPTLVICTHPKNMPDPCISIQSHLSKKGFKLISNFGSEAVGGPSWSTLRVLSHA